MPPKRRLGLAWKVNAGIGALIVIALLLFSSTRRDPTDEAYVGRDVCAGCHAAQVDAWTGSHHDLAMQEATPSAVLGDFSGVDFTHGGVTSTFSERDGAYFVRTDGPEGALGEYEVAYTFGVTPLQQYLIGLPGGRYQALTVAWDSRAESEGGQRWFHLYPDAPVGPRDPLHWTQPSQNWNWACAECHSTGLDKGFNFLSRTYDTQWSEIDVSCEACHGPGARHVELAEEASREGTGLAGVGGLTVELHDAGRAWTVSPGATTATRSRPRTSDTEIETCALCHARRLPIREGRVAGEPLLETHVPALLEAGLYHPDGQILEEVYVYGSFVQSRMYQAGVSCADCHDPHTTRTRAEGNALCTQCHLPSAYDAPGHHFHEQASEGAQCVACHMPERTYMVVDPRRDHSLRVPRPDLTVSIGTPNACSTCHADEGAAWAAEAVEAWYGPRATLPTHYGEVIAAARIGDPSAGAEIVTLAGDTAAAPIVRATALTLLTGYPPTTISGAIGAGLRDADPLVRLGALRALPGLPQRTAAALAFPALADTIRAVRIEAARALAGLPRPAMSVEQAELLNRVLDEYGDAQMVDADRGSAWVNLAQLAIRTRHVRARPAPRACVSSRR